MAKPVAKLFRDAPSAQKAVGQLQAQGYKAEDIGGYLKQMWSA